MFGEHPVELGLHAGDDFLPALHSDKRYLALFAEAFPGQSDPDSIDNITKAIASFERSIISARSPYDRYHYDRDDTAVSESAKRGEVLFFSQYISCFRCHGGFNFSDATSPNVTPIAPLNFTTRVCTILWALCHPPRPSRRGKVQNAYVAKHRTDRALHSPMAALRLSKV